jgi:hypothetical protein
MGEVALMSPFSADPFRSASANPVHPAATSFADALCATVARLFAYVGTLALVGILAVRGCDQLLIMLADASNPGWTIADRPGPASPVNQADLTDKTEPYSTPKYPTVGTGSVMGGAGGASTPSADWLTAPESPRLRGGL